MKLDGRHVAKTDPFLEDTLKRAREDESIRAVIIVEPDAPPDSGDREPHPSEYPSRRAWREALIERRESRLADEIEGTIEELRKLSLKPRGGKMGRAVVVEGSARDIAASLELPGITHATLDRRIGLSDQG